MAFPTPPTPATDRPAATPADHVVRVRLTLRGPAGEVLPDPVPSPSPVLPPELAQATSATLAAWRASPDERLVLRGVFAGLGRGMTPTREELPALWRRAADDLAATGMLWSPLADAVACCNWPTGAGGSEGRFPTEGALVAYLTTAPAAVNLAVLRTFRAPEVRRAVAQHAREWTPELAREVVDHHRGMLQVLARNPALPAAAADVVAATLLEELAGDLGKAVTLKSLAQVRYGAAGCSAPLRAAIDAAFVEHARTHRSALDAALLGETLGPGMVDALLDAITVDATWDVLETDLAKLLKRPDVTPDQRARALAQYERHPRVVGQGRTEAVQAQRLVAALPREAPLPPATLVALADRVAGHTFDAKLDPLEAIVVNAGATPVVWAHVLTQSKAVAIRCVVAAIDGAAADAAVRALLVKGHGGRQAGLLAAALRHATAAEWPGLFARLAEVDVTQAVEFLETHTPPAGVALGAILPALKAADLQLRVRAQVRLSGLAGALRGAAGPAATPPTVTDRDTTAEPDLPSAPSAPAPRRLGFARARRR